MSRRTIRGLAISSLVAQPIFIGAWVIGGALEPGYSHVRQAISELGAGGAAHPWLDQAAIVIFGLSFVALGLALYGVLPRGRAATTATGLFIAAGLAIAAAGPLNLDCRISEQPCWDAFQAGDLSWQTYAHAWLSLAGQVLLTLTPFAIAWALRPSPAAAAALVAGLSGLLVGGVASVFGDGPGGAPDGLLQRVGLLVLLLWVLIVVVGILWATRAPARPGKLVPLRPRDFMAQEWTGEGQLALRPLFLGSYFAQRFTARRRSLSISDTLWRIDDEADFGGGRVQRRRTYVDFVTPQHLRLTAADLPDGADIWLEDGGYRMAPFRMAFPIGPLPILIRVHDTSYVDGDGSFVNQFDARALGIRLPLARTTFRVRPVEPLPADAYAFSSQAPAD